MLHVHILLSWLGLAATHVMRLCRASSRLTKIPCCAEWHANHSLANIQLDAAAQLHELFGTCAKCRGLGQLPQDAVTACKHYKGLSHWPATMDFPGSAVQQAYSSSEWVSLSCGFPSFRSEEILSFRRIVQGPPPEEASFVVYCRCQNIKHSSIMGFRGEFTQNMALIRCAGADFLS